MQVHKKNFTKAKIVMGLTCVCVCVCVCVCMHLNIIYNFLFTFIHLADAFVQSYLQIIYNIQYIDLFIYFFKLYAHNL